MPHLLHIDASVKGDDQSVSRVLTARAVAAWKAANPTGTVTYRDLVATPLPVFDVQANLARYVPADQYNAEQAAARAATDELAGEILAADVVVFGLPLYNYAAPSQVKTWIDHLVFPGVHADAAGEGLLGGREFHVIHTRGGGYGEGTPREGWDHAGQWFLHVLSTMGIEANMITAELTLAGIVPAMESLKPLAAESLAAAEADIDGLFATASV